MNVFNVAASPANGNVVFAQGVDLDESDAGAPNHGRHIWRSIDGGLSWASVAEEDGVNGFFMPNGAVMAAHPANPDVLYWLFGTPSFDYGTDVYRLDVSAGAPTKTHNTYDKMSAIAFHPGHPSVLYLGSTASRASSKPRVGAPPHAASEQLGVGESGPPPEPGQETEGVFVEPRLYDASHGACHTAI